MKTLGNRIKDCRKSLGLTQDELGRKCGLGQTDISKLEVGTVPETTKMAELARALKVDAYWLATGKGTATPYHPLTNEGVLAAKLIDGIEDERDRQKALKVTAVAAEPKEDIRHG